MRVLAVLWIFFAALAPGAARAEGASTLANINQGNALVFGDVFYRASSNDQPNEFNLSLGAGYFVIDHLALGAHLGYRSISNQNSIASLGPVVQYEFWHQDRWATYVEAISSFGLTDATLKAELGGQIGLQYFITPSIAAGPYFQYRHNFSHFNDWNDTFFGASFGMFI